MSTYRVYIEWGGQPAVVRAQARELTEAGFEVRVDEDRDLDGEAELVIQLDEIPGSGPFEAVTEALNRLGAADVELPGGVPGGVSIKTTDEISY